MNLESYSFTKIIEKGRKEFGHVLLHILYLLMNTYCNLFLFEINETIYLFSFDVFLTLIWSIWGIISTNKIFTNNGTI